MSKLTDNYRTIGVHNAFEFARDKGNIWIAYNPNDYGRGGRSACWHVIGVGIETDPSAHWQDYGSKWFGLFNSAGSHVERKAKALGEAKKWASEKYGIKTWARTPFGDWMDAGFVKQRMAELARELANHKERHRKATGGAAHPKSR